ncbi:hypothetical protein BTO05_13165 [Winogradskyella sp. PC-19]|nr:hypothetical protein BTO05_13165 [Winogradskyella sp. PC-19]
MYSQSNKIKIEGVNTEVKTLKDTPEVGFYKTTETNRYFIENKKNSSGLVYLENLSYPSTNGKNRGKLLVIFSDCVSVRTKTSKSDISEGLIAQLIEEYTNCESYSEDFELSKRQKKDQSYANQESIINYDFGFGYYSQELEFMVNDNPSLTNSEGGLSAFVSINISPKHLGSLTGRLFYDFTLQYNFKTAYEFSTFDNKISSVQLTIAPKYYFSKSNATIYPFIGASIGAVLLKYDYTDTSSVVFQNVDSSDTKVIYGFEIGAQILTDFEVTLSYYPDYKFGIFIDDINTVNSRFKNLNFKLGYKF